MLSINLATTATRFGVPLFTVDAVGKHKPTGQTLGQILAETLASSSSKQSRKRYKWAETLFANESLSLDGDDFDLLFKFVEDSELFDFIKAPILDILSAAKQA